jgi:UDP-glucuronate 4-epimerase
MNFLLTGSAGFIGFHLTQRLLAEGHTITGFDGITPYYDVSLKKARHAILAKSNSFTPVIGMLEDTKSLHQAAEIAKPDVIIHLAAQAGVRYSLENPRAYIDSNLVGSWNVLELARELKPKHLLLASSSSIYGSNEKVPFEERDRADQPLSLYAATKKSMELMGHAYSHLHRIPITAFRFFTVYGPWGRPDMALFKFTDAILHDRPIEVYGEGRMQRDFTYVGDLIEAIVRLIPLAPINNSLASFRAVNIGGGQPVGLVEFIDTLESALGRKAMRRMCPMQLGDVSRTFASPALLEQLTGYRPSTPLSIGVRDFVAWYLSYYSV